VSGRQPGGQAKVAIVSSGVYGMMSGSPTADVVTTGSITIPIMVRTGYKPYMAAAIEVAASTGGNLMPPVMGSAAFIMAEYTGIPYREIMIAALVPGSLYYFAVFMQVDIRARMQGIGGLREDEIHPLWRTLKSGGVFIVPLIAVTWGLLSGYTPTYSAAFGILAIIAVSLVYNMPRAVTAQPMLAGKRLTVTVFDLLAETSLRMVGVAGACAAAGLVISTISMTGLAGKFSSVIFLIAGQNEFIILVVAGMLTIILGLGMPTPSAYILAAVLVGPTLTELDFSMISAHLFLLYFAALSSMTPPVAVAAYAAAAIANENPLRVAAQATRIAIVAFVLPFVFVYSPALLLEGAWPTILAVTVLITGMVAALSVGIEGYCLRYLTGWERLIIIAAALAGMTLSVPGTVIFVTVVVVLSWRLRLTPH
jgi:TRAP transporter 4TM/12TM fusion protein